MVFLLGVGATFLFSSPSSFSSSFPLLFLLFLPFYCWFHLTFEKGSDLKLTTKWGMALVPIFLHSSPQDCYYRPFPPHPVRVVLEIKPRAPTNEASTLITELEPQHCFVCFEAEPHTVALAS